MKCLVVCEPFASALIFGAKDPENRSRRLPLFGPTLILAGKSLDWFTGDLCRWTHERWPACPPSAILALHAFKHRMGKIIGAVDFGEPYDFDPRAEGATLPTPWATGPACHPALDRCAFTKPFNWRGQQGVFTVPAAQIPDECHIELGAMYARSERRTQTRSGKQGPQPF